MAVSAAPVAAQAASDAPTLPAAQAAKVDTAYGDKIVCKATTFTGSRITRQVCQNRREWEKQALHAEETVGDMHRTSDHWGPH
ncbi:MAG: hypothetical protein ABI242_07300 [Caulobacteraceae bacterium]